MEKTKEMESSMKRLDEEMRRSDDLLSQMIPKSVAEKVKAGLNPVETCEVFDQVTIIFNDVPAFLDICAKCDGMKIVEMLNTMFGIFDLLTDKNGVYKVETVKDSFVGVSGAPERVSKPFYQLPGFLNTLKGLSGQESCRKNHGHGLGYERLCDLC